MVSLACQSKELLNLASAIEAHEDHLILRYTTASDTIEGKITISKRPCNFGGFQKYLICPECGKRVVTLYGGKYFRCRHCYDFCYTSQLERPTFRLSRKARKLADKVAGDSDLGYGGFPAKQSQKHCKKYVQHRREHDRIMREAFSYVPGDDYPFG